MGYVRIKKYCYHYNIKQVYTLTANTLKNIKDNITKVFFVSKTVGSAKVMVNNGTRQERPEIIFILTIVKNYVNLKDIYWNITMKKFNIYYNFQTSKII